MHQAIVELNTARTILKGVNPALVRELFSREDDTELLLRFGADVARLNRLRQGYLHGMETHEIGFYFFTIHRPGDARAIGECGFHTWNHRHHSAEVFYLLHREEEKKQGLMTEVLNRVLEFGFGEMGLHRTQALVSDGNTPSLKLLDRFRFRYEGRRREDYFTSGNYEDSLLYSLIVHEWGNQRNDRS